MDCEQLLCFVELELVETVLEPVLVVQLVEIIVLLLLLAGDGVHLEARLGEL